MRYAILLCVAALVAGCQKADMPTGGDAKIDKPIESASSPTPKPVISPPAVPITPPATPRVVDPPVAPVPKRPQRPTMAEIADMIRDAMPADTYEAVLAQVPLKGDTFERELESFAWVRYPARDGFVWVRLFLIQIDGGDGPQFMPRSIQFSTTGQRVEASD